jgi:ferredoxin-NADP reductase
MRLLYSVRNAADVIYARELALGDETTVTYTRGAPPGWEGHRGRLDAAMVAAAGVDPATGHAWSCGSNGFVESASRLLLDAGFAPERIKTERYGPTG